MVQIKDSVFVVTGGSSGLGKGCTDMFLSEGACVTIIDANKPLNDNFDKFSDRLLFFQADVRSELEIQNALTATKEKFGKINGLVHCAGIFKKGDEVFNTETQKPGNLAVFAEILNINLLGTLNVDRLVIPFFLENEKDQDGQKGIIINTSSATGHTGNQMTTGIAYSIGKSAIIALTYPLARQLSPFGIRVMDIAPGLCDTALIQKAVQHNQTLAQSENLFPSRLVLPSDFGNIVKHIIRSPMLNGFSLRLDGAVRF